MFIWSAVAHLIALTSPGPDTAIVIRQTSIYGRADGIKAALGIGIGIYIHCILAINGISLIILANDTYKLLISLIGSLYIIYLGITMLKSKSEININKDSKKSHPYNSFLIGLITNIFNVKAFLFFVSLFSILIDSLYGFYFYLFPVYFAITSAMWFIFVSYILTISADKTFNIFSNKYIPLVMSLVLFGIGTFILISSLNEYF